jgi:rod shape-determining protein MreC
VPRNRTVRLAVLGSSVQRAANSGYPSNRSSALKRRIVVGVLVLLSLVLITISFRSSKLDPVQGAAASALRPFEVAAERVSRPFRDAVGWTRGMFNAKSENKKLSRQVEDLRRQVIQNESALQENVKLRRLLDYRDSPRFPQDFRAVAARVLTSPPSRFDQQVTISAGSHDGIAEQDVVVTADGLVGQVTKVHGSVAQVTLVTDEASAVRAADLTNPSAGGILRHGSGAADSLILDRVPKAKFIARGDVIITAGSPGKGQLPSIYPRNIEIGLVTSVGQNDTDLFKQIQVQPFVDLSSLQSVLVLVPKAGRRGVH